MLLNWAGGEHQVYMFFTQKIKSALTLTEYEFDGLICKLAENSVVQHSYLENIICCPTVVKHMHYIMFMSIIIFFTLSISFLEAEIFGFLWMEKYEDIANTNVEIPSQLL